MQNEKMEITNFNFLKFELIHYVICSTFLFVFFRSRCYCKHQQNIMIEQQLKRAHRKCQRRSIKINVFFSLKCKKRVINAPDI